MHVSPNVLGIWPGESQNSNCMHHKLLIDYIVHNNDEFILSRRSSHLVCWEFAQEENAAVEQVELQEFW